MGDDETPRPMIQKSRKARGRARANVGGEMFGVENYEGDINSKETKASVGGKNDIWKLQQILRRKRCSQDILKLEKGKIR